MKENYVLNNETLHGNVNLISNHFTTEEPIQMVLSKWHILVSGKINNPRNELLLFPDEDIAETIAQSDALQDRIKILLINGLIDRVLIKDKQQFVQINQAMLIRFLNVLYSYKQNSAIDDNKKCLINTIARHLQNTLNFIEDFFSNYFDHNERVPASYLALCKEKWRNQVNELNLSLLKDDAKDKKLTKIISDFFEKLLTTESRCVTYHQMAYYNDLLKELFSEKVLTTTQSIRETLYYFNFNEEDFVFYEFERLKQLTDNLPTPREKVAALCYEQKIINQLPVRVNIGYTTCMPSLKEQVSCWITEEIKYLEKGGLNENNVNTVPDAENKIQTSLSVAKLAVIIRLLVIDKIIINRTVAPMLRIVAKIFTTLQKDEISFGSLETKYHAPDKATINAVRDMLFKWINILGKL